MSIRQASYADLIDPVMYTLDKAEEVALQLMAEGQRIPERFALALMAELPPDAGSAQRMLELLPRIAPPARMLPLLDRIMPSSNSRIRSKAWKLYSAASLDVSWALAQINDPDPRVAANVVESLWRATPSEQLRELFACAARQQRNRVAGNGLVGLFNQNDPAAPEVADILAHHEDPNFRASCAWAMGRVRWKEGLGLLKAMRTDAVEKVRINAERSILRILRRYPDAD